MEQDIYNYVMELLDDLIYFKGYKIDNKDIFCKKITQKISSDKVTLVLFGEMDEEIEDLIDKEYMIMKGNNQISNIEIVNDSVKNFNKFQVADTEVKEDDVINHVVNILNNSDYTFANSDYPNVINDMNYLKSTAKSILKWHFSKEQYNDIINGEYDEQIFQLAVFRSVEFSVARNISYESLKYNYYYTNYNQLFNPKIVNNIICNASIVLLSAKKEGIELNSDKIVNEVVLRTIFPNGVKKQKESFGSKFDYLKKSVTPTREETVFLGFVAFGLLTDLAIPAIVVPLLAYKSQMGGKIQKSDIIDALNNHKSR